jgi:hypothetical protein
MYVWVHDPSRRHHPYYPAIRYKRPSPPEPKPEREFVTALAQAVTTAEPLRLHTRIFPVLGGNLYSDHASRVAVREVLQNAWDAVAHRPDGHIHITLDGQLKSISTQDNGVGMTPEEVREFLLTLGGSGKVEGGMAGGFGIGKVAIFMGSDNFVIETVAVKDGRKVKTTVSGDKASLMETGKVTVQEEEVDPTTPTGTKVTLIFNDPQEFGRAALFITEMRMYQVRELPFKVTIEELNFPADFSGFLRPSKVPRFAVRPISQHQEDERTLWDYYETEEKVEERESVIRVVFLNNGLYQGMDYIYLPESIVGVPMRVFVDVRTTIPPEDPEYPWRADRHTLKPNLMQKVVEWALDRYYRGVKLKETEQYETALREAEPLTAGVKFIWGKAKDDERLKQTVSSLLKHPDFLDATRIIANYTRRLFQRLYPNDPVPDIYFTFDPRFYGRFNIYKERATLFINPLMLFRLGVKMAMKYLHLKSPAKTAEAFYAEHWAGQTFATIAHEITHQEVRAHDEEFAGELTRLTGVIDAMGWKTNSMAWVAKRYEKVLGMMGTLARQLDVEGNEHLFQIEGLKESD